MAFRPRLRPTDTKGHTETGSRLKVSSDRLEKTGVELTTPGVQGDQLYHQTTEASRLTGKLQDIEYAYI